MRPDYVLLINYLEYSELQVITNYLKADKIDYIVKEQGGTLGYGDSDYRIILVNRKDYSRAKIIAKNFKSTIKKNSKKCPKCKSEELEKIEFKNLLQKFLYFGTKSVRCKKCKTKFVI